MINNRFNMEEVLMRLTPGERLVIEMKDHDTIIRYERAGHHTEIAIPNEEFIPEERFELAFNYSNLIMKQLDRLEGLVR